MGSEFLRFESWDLRSGICDLGCTNLRRVTAPLAHSLVDSLVDSLVELKSARQTQLAKTPTTNGRSDEQEQRGVEGAAKGRKNAERHNQTR